MGTQRAAQPQLVAITPFELLGQHRVQQLFEGTAGRFLISTATPISQFSTPLRNLRRNHTGRLAIGNLTSR